MITKTKILIGFLILISVISVGLLLYSKEFVAEEKKAKNCNHYKLPMTKEQMEECTCPKGYKKFPRLGGVYCATDSQKPCKTDKDCPKGEHCISFDRKDWFCTGGVTGCFYLSDPNNPEGVGVCID
jgi:hypothetical protein